MKTILITIATLVTLGIAAMATFVFVVQSVEQPAYGTLVDDDPFELRAYPDLIAAEVVRPGTRREALRDGFAPLAGYIFAKDREGARLSMTAPVTQAPADSGDWSVRFFMPAQYRFEDLPRPADSEVRLRELTARRVAAVRFSGRTTDERVAAREAELRAWMSERGLSPASQPVYAYYNDPLTPGFLRRNEVLIEVVGETAAAEVETE
jgi:hypothetical protein